jgi:hypothetical protein
MSPRWRRYGSVAMLAAGLICLLGATLTLYAKDRILDADQFADESVATLNDPSVDRIVSSAVTNRVIDRIDPDLVSFKPLIESVVASLLDTDAIRGALRQGVRAAHAAVFDRETDGAVIRLADVGALVRGALEAVSPQVAAEVPRGLDATIVRLSDQPLLVDASQAADRVDRWAGILPGLAIALVGGSILVAEQRRRAVIRAGLSIVVLAAVLIVALKVGRLALLDRVHAGDRRDAAAAVWEGFLGDLGSWALALAAVGVVLATAAASMLRAFDLHEPLRQAWARITHEPATGRGRAAWGLGLAAAGGLMVFAPGELLRGLVVAVGVYLIARAVALVVRAVAEWRGWSLERGESTAEAAERADPISPRRVLLTGAATVAVAAVAVGVGLSLALRQSDAAPPAGAKGRCNGSRALCDRTLDKVAFLGTHNSYAGADYPDFLFPEQEGTIPSQLEAGVRGLWIDTYYGSPGRRVYTRTDRIDPALNAQLREQLGPKFEQAAARVRARVAQPPADAPQRIYLCHGYCELGAVDAEEAITAIRDFLRQNPGEVLIIDLEDYTTPADTVALLRKTGLAAYVYKGPSGPPWPTLGEMVDSGGRVLVVVEHRTAGAPRWYRPAYRRVFQETPFKFKTPAEMSCAPNRGRASNSLFLINNWIDTDPTPKPSNAAKVNAYDFLLQRARRCERQRGRFPNVINVDFFAEGEPGRVVATLNRHR